MINFLSLEFLFGIIIGCLIVMAIYQLTKKNNDEITTKKPDQNDDRTFH